MVLMWKPFRVYEHAGRVNSKVTTCLVCVRWYPLHPDRGAVWTGQPTCCLHDRRDRQLAVQLRCGPLVPIHTGELPDLNVHVCTAYWAQRTHSYDGNRHFSNLPHASVRLAAVCFWLCLLCLIQWHMAAFLFILPMSHAKLFSML